MTNETKKDIDHLNSFLRGERSAVETYEQCIERVDDPRLSSQFEQLRDSHVQRVHKLSSRITTLGGVPADDSGMWGSFAKLVEGGAGMFGTDAAIAALEEGEDHGVSDYESGLNDLTPPTRQFVASEIVPEQHRTHDTLSALKNGS